jgi:hypothetical protein
MKPNFFMTETDATNLYTACFVAAERYDAHVKEFAALVLATPDKNPEAASRRVGYGRLRDQFERQAKDIRALAARINEVEQV